jgi:GntR family transcriptional regulator/MocR family aminotransferase
MTIPPRGSRMILSSLHNQLRSAILDGRLKAGLRLPSTRALAATYGVARNIAVTAYELLSAEGYVSAHRGSGTVVATRLASKSKHRRIQRAPGSEQKLNRYWRERSLPAQDAADAEPRYAFQVGLPDVANFPYATWRRLSGRVLRRFQFGSAHSFDPQGLNTLREAIAQHVSFTRAVTCGPEDIVVTTGAQQAFDVLARVLTTKGRPSVAVENPGYRRLRAAFQAHGAGICPVAVDQEGLLVDRLPATVRVVCVTPSHQFPLGAVMSARRRTALLEYCQRRGAVVIEDDYDSEFRFADRPLDALQTLDRAQSVFYVGTFSKTLLPDLRLGYIVTPPWALAAIVIAKQFSDGPCSALTQATAALLIKEGYLARHVRKMQRVYTKRRNLLLRSLHSDLGRWLVPLPSVAGLHVTARLQQTCDEASVIAHAKRLGVRVGALRPYYAGRPSMGGLVFGFGNIDETAIAEGLARLRQALPDPSTYTQNSLRGCKVR